MKVDAKQLFEVVRQVVRDEVQKALPQMIAKHLSEQYIRKALLEAAAQQPQARPAAPQNKQRQPYRLPTNLREIIAGDEQEEEVTPQLKDNDDLGIYEPSNPSVKHTPENESVVAKLLSKDNPMSHIYEGIQPIDADERALDVSLNAVAKVTGMDFSKMNALVDGLENTAKKKSAMTLSEDSQMRELERKRKLLEIPVQRRPAVR